jgi:hypothetical protein
MTSENVGLHWPRFSLILDLTFFSIEDTDACSKYSAKRDRPPQTHRHFSNFLSSLWLDPDSACQEERNLQGTKRHLPHSIDTPTKSCSVIHVLASTKISEWLDYQAKLKTIGEMHDATRRGCAQANRFDHPSHVANCANSATLHFQLLQVFCVCTSERVEHFVLGVCRP